ncbi:MAG TPA: DUF1569 domain-containing protein [Terriglobales bacterium]|nr:DUF1569 domain-containing protein [Terriglobales bacterium]
MDAYLQRLQDAIASATEGMTAEELRRHPKGKWCAAEILEHLYLTYTGTTKAFERCLQAGQPQVRRRTLRDRVRTSVVIGLGHMPNGRQAPKHAQPRGMSVEEVAAEIGSRISAMDAVIAQCESRVGKRTRVLDHPVLGPLTARQWRKFHWVHGRHHLKQIQNLRWQS